MAAGRSLKSLMGRRRRAEEEGEDEEGSVLVDDSQSDGSILSDVVDEDAAVSSLGGQEAQEMEPGTTDNTPAEAVVSVQRASAPKAKKSRKKAVKRQVKDEKAEALLEPQTSGFKATADTEVMMNGLQIADLGAQHVVDFEDSDRTAQAVAAPGIHRAVATTSNGVSQSPAPRQRQEHVEYKRQRDGDPAFIPNRGNFFMHDTRSAGGQGGPVRGAWSGRGRARGPGVPGGGHISGLPANPSAQVERAAEQPWKHDLHDTINEEPAPTATAKTAETNLVQGGPVRAFPKTTTIDQGQQQSRVLSFSSTTLIGKVQIRVALSGMNAPITFSEVPWHQYTRLPDHRPPLRRDKPVRISLPDHVQRYVFPSADRSFIFIPRQMRPNQQGFGRIAYQRSIGGYGYSSRRTSMYGGSMYAVSVAASRRSSFASVARESAFSPVGSYGGAMQPSRPVVRLPHGSHSHFSTPSTPMGPLSGHQTPSGMQVHTFPLPQQPAFQGTPTTTVHQPRPQKTISVNDIESPAVLQQASARSESRPFQNQLPAHMNEQPPFNLQGQLPYYSPRQQFAHPQQQQQAGTPLSGIPEQAMHASSFQAPIMPYGGPPYYGQFPAQQGFYYPAGPNGYQQMPMYAPPPQGYMMPPPAAAMPPHQDLPPLQSQPMAESEPALSQPEHSQSQSGMVAHESNGMVFYLPASEAEQQPQGEHYQPAESFVPAYAMPGLPPPTPAPDAAYYYPPQMQVPSYYHPQPQS